MRFLKQVIARTLALTMLLLSGCAGAGQESGSASRSVFAMDTVMDVTAYGPDAEKAAVAAIDRITELEQVFSVTIDGSDIDAVNHGYDIRLHAVIGNGAVGRHCDCKFMSVARFKCRCGKFALCKS